MKIVNATGSDLNATMVAGAKAAYKPGGARPSKSVKSLTLDPASDIFVYIVKMGNTPISDSVTILQGNPFRITAAYNELMPDWVSYPFISWKGGNPPFQIQLAHMDLISGVPSNVVTGMSVNILTGLSDGTGDIVTAGMAREYIIEHQFVEDPWWANDLNGVDRLDEIGLLITDSSEPPISLFAPFRPEITLAEDGTTKTGLSAIYEQYGPPESETFIVWSPDLTRPYGEYFWDKALHPADLATQFTAEATFISVDGTVLPAGTHGYYSDELFTTQIVGYAQPDMGTVTYYYRFVPTDLVTYQVAVKKRTFTIEKALPVVVWAITSYSYGYLTWAVFESPVFKRTDNRLDPVVVVGTPTTSLSGANASNTASFSNSSAYITPDTFNIVYGFTPSDLLRYLAVSGDSHPFTIAKNTPTINYGTSFSYARGAVTYYQLMVLMQLSNSWRGEVAPWIITPSAGSGYTYTVTNHASGITISTADNSTKLNSAIPSDTSFNVAMSWTPQGANVALYNATSINFTVAIAGYTTLAAVWTVSAHTRTEYWFDGTTHALYLTVPNIASAYVGMTMSVNSNRTVTSSFDSSMTNWTQPSGGFRIQTNYAYTQPLTSVLSYVQYNASNVAVDAYSITMTYDYWGTSGGNHVREAHTITFTRPN
jgi:hypothetical protein